MYTFTFSNLRLLTNILLKFKNYTLFPKIALKICYAAQYYPRRLMYSPSLERTK